VARAGGVDVSESGTSPDVEPSQWPDPSVTYDAVASPYADAFLNELEHKPFDQETAPTTGLRNFSRVPSPP
jgi:hypothetical protein